MDILTQAISTIPHIVTEANASGRRISKLSIDVVDSDAKIKRGLTELETIVAAQGEAIRNDVQAAFIDIGNFLHEGSPGGPGVSRGTTTEEV